MFIKYTPSQTHFSLRSKNHIDVGRMARRVPGGGGHVNAAGCTIEAPIDDALPRMLTIVDEELG
jgi:phosphoesterase RecJ-like protein